MITPSFALTATERVLPRMALDFTTANLDSRVTFTRTGNTATVTNSSGVLAAINADLPRFDYDPTTLVCKGLLIEELRTNILLNSLLNGTNLSTQLVTTVATPYTLSFYGTGQIVLTGSSSATVVGTGAYPSRKTLTFTPTAGVLTLTVTGTVQYAQLEAGAFASSFIPTAATVVTRNPDVAAMTGTNFSSWYNQTQGSFTTEFDFNNAVLETNWVLQVDDGTQQNSNYIWRWTGNGNLFNTALTGNVLLAQVASGVVIVKDAINKVSNALGTNAFGVAFNGNTATSVTPYTAPTVNTLRIGSAISVFYFNGHIRKINYYLPRLINAELQAFSK